MNKFFGILLYIVGVLFTLAFIGQLTSFLEIIVGLAKLFSGDLTASQVGYLMGSILYWMVHFAIIFFAFKYGSKLFKKKRPLEQS